MVLMFPFKSKKMNKIKTIIFVAILPLVTSLNWSCKKFLDEENKTSITQQNYFTNATQAQSAIDGIYDYVRSAFQNRDGIGEAPWSSMEFLVGHATTAQSLYNINMINHNASTSDPVFSSVWNNLYKGISNANLSLQKIPGITMDETKKKNLLGQAYFLRAFYYYHLVRLYGDVPLITEPVDANSPFLYPDRASSQSVYDLVVSDLKMAEQSGLANVDKTGRVSIGAVKSLLSSVYLTMAGFPLNKGAEYYTLAANKAEEVLDANWYTLFTDYYFLHDRAHKNQGELIFQAQFSGSIAGNRIISMITPANIGISKISEEQGAIMARDEFVHSYESTDKRIQEKQFYFTEYLARDGASIKKFGQYALYKYWIEEAAGPAGDANPDNNWTFLRLPELMLIYAEATNEVSGPTEKARLQLKTIRDRAEIATPALASLNKDSFRQEIWKERYHEMSFENKAYFDIQRTHKVYDLKNNVFTDALTFTNESAVRFNEKYFLWPLPQNERDTNKKLSQNTGW